jgi:hypothetical protein
LIKENIRFLGACGPLHGCNDLIIVTLDEVEEWMGIGDIKGCDGEDCVWSLKKIMRGVNSCAI